MVLFFLRVPTKRLSPLFEHPLFGVRTMMTCRYRKYFFVGVLVDPGREVSYLMSNKLSAGVPLSNALSVYASETFLTRKDGVNLLF